MSAPGKNDFRILKDAPLPVRLLTLFVGLFLFGVSCGLLVVSALGNAPWDVLHEGVARHLPISLGVVGVCVSVLILLLWIPLKQKPGLGTVANALLVGPFIDLTVHVVPTPDTLWERLLLVVAGVVLNGIATVMYIAPAFGPGPRDGLMTGLVALTGKPVFLIRTGIEVAVVAIGWLLGGTFFIASIVFAFGIGPVTQVCLRLAHRMARPTRPEPGTREVLDPGTPDAATGTDDLPGPTGGTADR
ncbi:YczE/YyaS/YitT family protein [Brevibacterium litoralis]|uniref:membrane protein YczE n=1 Tax=Brevibacterium litoralis TaxID=3138935 RepID=UPI0032ED4F29